MLVIKNFDGPAEQLAKQLAPSFTETSYNYYKF